LQVLAIWLLFTYNRFHRAKGLGWANEITGRINKQYNKVEDFFNMKDENKRVHQLNDSLINLLSSNFLRSDTNLLLVKDSLPYDTLGNYRRYFWRPAEVIYNTVNVQRNYIQINRGSTQGIKDNMAVISSNGAIVGDVVNVSSNFSQIRSVLHVEHRASIALKKTSDVGTLKWDGKDPLQLTIEKIPNSIVVQKGDTIVTSRYSFNYPPGLMVGTVTEIIAEKNTNFNILKVRPAANFFNLQQVFVVENVQYDEQVKLFNETKKKIEEPKKSNR
jgi:rod shape-determining protein MreC